MTFFTVRTHGEDQLNKIVDYLNGIHNTINFTHEDSKYEVHFLDTTVRILPNRILYNILYTKPTGTHLYLHYNSAHPHSVTAKGPYGQFLRLRLICTLEQDYQYHGEKIIKYCIARGSPQKPWNNTTKK